MPAVSILMPVYNASKFLKDAMDSILAQTFTDFELILINDGSTDNSEAIIKTYNDQRIRYYQQENSGVAATLNRGISLATAKYIWRHDADDISLPDRLEKQIWFLEDHPEFALCGTQIAFMTESGKIAWRYRQPQNAYFAARQYVDVERKDFSPYSPITHATVLIRREIILDFGGFRSEFITGEDVDLWLRIIQKYRAAVLNQCLYFVRINKGSATRKHGWKNEFFRNLAFKYYEQREQTGMDDLQRGIPVELPLTKPSSVVVDSPKGKLLRSDLLGFQYPLHLNAGDWKECARMVRLAVKDGWKLNATWKGVIFPLLGKKMVQRGVKIKRWLKRD